MQHLPSEEPRSKESNKQGLEVNKSNLTNSPIGQAGGNINQAGGDINYFFNTLQGDWTEDKINKVRKFEESLRQEFKEKLDKAALLVNDLKICVEHQLKDGNPKDSTTILKLLDELQSALGKESRIKAISKHYELCYEGGLWLQKNSHNLALLAKDHVFNVFRQQGLSVTVKSKASKLSLSELEARLVCDIETYIEWISAYLKAGKTPNSQDFQGNVFNVHLDFPQSIYKEAFRSLTLNAIDPLVSGLSKDAAKSTVSYFNRFLINRDLSNDNRVFRRIFYSLQKSFLQLFKDRLILMLFLIFFGLIAMLALSLIK